MRKKHVVKVACFDNSQYLCNRLGYYPENSNQGNIKGWGFL